LPVRATGDVVAFLRDTLGLPLKIQDGDRYAAFQFGGLTLALLGESERIVEQPALCFRVDDVVSSLTAAEAAGAEAIRGVEQGPHEKRAVVRIPGGSVLVLSEKTA
jgi:hypothetical protein